MEKTYIDDLRQELTVLKDSGKEFDTELLYLPDFVGVLCSMMDDVHVDRHARLMINVALGYLFIPNDVVPESIYGPYGYMDDMYIACLVLYNLIPKYSKLIHTLWENSEDLDAILSQCTKKSERFLSETNLKERALRYCGLID